MLLGGVGASPDLDSFDPESKMSGFSVTPDSMRGLATAMDDLNQQIETLGKVTPADLTQFADGQVIESIDLFNRSLNDALDYFGDSLVSLALRLREGATYYAQNDDGVCTGFGGGS